MHGWQVGSTHSIGMLSCVISDGVMVLLEFLMDWHFVGFANVYTLFPFS